MKSILLIFLLSFLDVCTSSSNGFIVNFYDAGDQLLFTSYNNDSYSHFLLLLI